MTETNQSNSIGVIRFFFPRVVTLKHVFDPAKRYTFDFSPGIPLLRPGKREPQPWYRAVSTRMLTLAGMHCKASPSACGWRHHPAWCFGMQIHLGSCITLPRGIRMMQRADCCGERTSTRWQQEYEPQGISQMQRFLSYVELLQPQSSTRR